MKTRELDSVSLKVRNLKNFTSIENTFHNVFCKIIIFKKSMLLAFRFDFFYSIEAKNNLKYD